MRGAPVHWRSLLGLCAFQPTPSLTPLFLSALICSSVPFCSSFFLQTQVERDAKDSDRYASHADRRESGATDALPTHEPRATPAHDGRVRAHAQRRTTAAGALARHAMSCARAPAAATTVHFVFAVSHPQPSSTQLHSLFEKPQNFWSTLKSRSMRNTSWNELPFSQHVNMCIFI